MTYTLKNQLTMGGQAALMENAERMTNNVLQNIDHIANGDISRKHVEQAINVQIEWEKKFPISASFEYE